VHANQPGLARKRNGPAAPLPCREIASGGSCPAFGRCCFPYASRLPSWEAAWQHRLTYEFELVTWFWRPGEDLNL
jgi:hypothetical protein